MVPDKIERLCLKARQAIEQREWEKAKQAYLMALGLKSDLPDVHYGLATVYFQLQELTSAAHHFREVTRLDPMRAGAYVNLGAVLNLLNQYDEAIAALRRSIQIDTQRTEGYYNLGLVYRRKGQIDMAIQAYREAIRLNPRMPDAHHNLANLFFEKENFRQALQHYQLALQIRPNWAKAIEGMERTQATLSGEEPQEAPTKVGNLSLGTGTKSAKSGNELDKVVDPVANGPMLTTLHQATINSEDVGKQLEQILLQEIEPAIKELSSCLLYPNGARSELEACVRAFETALNRMRLAQQGLASNMLKVRGLGENFPNV
jgi:tetratricopeptide (TPR) repeat protein